MATDALVKRSLAAGRTYESLPDRIKAAIPVSEWNGRVREQCIARGLSWKDSLAKSICNEGEYYEELIAFYARDLRVFPYHLSEYVCRQMRYTPFRYNKEVLFSVMYKEKSYDSIPNFLAADILRLVGVGRNEYISLMNRGKAKKLMWRINRSSILQDLLPTEPVDVQFSSWWLVNVVNLSEQEYRRLSEAESSLCQKACAPDGLRVQQAESRLLQRLYKQGFIYLDVPVSPKNHVRIPPLEGFVSNKDSEKGEDKGDPMESVLYAMFVACSEKTSVAKLADILNVEPPKLVAAVSFACRLGFATCLPPSIEESLGDAFEADPSPGNQAQDIARTVAEDSGTSRGTGIALVVDTEVTSYLMMGALSPGLKRHSVSLFEGGRITGAEVIEELIRELDDSVATAAQFEGEMQMLSGYARSLSCILQFLQASAGSRPIEILRKETLENLDRGTAARVLSHAYHALVPIAPLPLPPLPLDTLSSGPADLGLTLASSTPWLQLCFFRLADSSLPSLILQAGQIFHSLPEQLQGCSHALVWPWNPDAVRAQKLPIILESQFLLDSLNEHLSCCSLIVQPVFMSSSSPAGKPRTVAIALPLADSNTVQNSLETAYDTDTGEALAVALPSGIRQAVNDLGLSLAIGSVTFIEVQRQARSEGEVSSNRSKSSDSGGNRDELNSAQNESKSSWVGSHKEGDEDAQHRTNAEGNEGLAQNLPRSHDVSREEEDITTTWVAYRLQLGLPLQPDTLCEAVCRSAEAKNVLSDTAIQQMKDSSSALHQKFEETMYEYTLYGKQWMGNESDEPQKLHDLALKPVTSNVYQHGKKIEQIRLSRYLQ